MKIAVPWLLRFSDALLIGLHSISNVPFNVPRGDYGNNQEYRSIV